MNTIKIKPYRTLLYYEGPILFVGRDQIKTNYLCALVEKKNGIDKFVAISVSPEKLYEVTMGKVDVHEAFAHPEMPTIYLIDRQENPEGLLELVVAESVDPSWLPNQGTVLNNLNSESNAQTLIDESRLKNATVIHLVFNPPESSHHVIATQNLVKGLSVFNSVVRASYKRAIKMLDKKTRKLLEFPDNYQTEVFAFSEGSFKVHLKSKLEADIFGYVNIEKALNKFDEIVTAVNDVEKSIDQLRDNKGHIVNTYKNLLEFIIENDSPLSYSWVSPQHNKVKSYFISKNQAVPLYDKIVGMQELSTETIELIGEITKVDVEKNLLTIKDDEDGKHYSGAAKPGLSLHGSTAGRVKYRFEIEEKIEVSEVSGKEIYTYSLVSYEEVRREI